MKKLISTRPLWLFLVITAATLLLPGPVIAKQDAASAPPTPAATPETAGQPQTGEPVATEQSAQEPSAPAVRSAQPNAAKDPATEAAAARAMPEQANGRQTKELVLSEKQMVVTANPYASRAANAMLAAGGSAVDAAIAAQMVLNLVEPQSSGIGGGAFLLAYDGTSRRVRVFDGRETAPGAVHPDHFLTANGQKMKFFDAVDSGLSVGVPGLLRMLDLAHRSHGKLAWEKLFQPAIELAEQGFEISPRLHESVKGAIKRIAAQPMAAAYFLTADGSAKPVGEVLRNEEFAQVLREVARDGADSFYSGKTAREIIIAVTSHNRRAGYINADDLRGYRALEREPLCGSYRELRICGMPPPSSGALTMLQTLSLLEGFALGSIAPDSARSVHLISEAYRLAYADRAHYIADPGYVDVPVKGLLDPTYSRARAGMISPEDSLGKPPHGSPPGAKHAGLDATIELSGTSHLSIVDERGNAVSMTSSIETAFGSLLMVRGFLLNNQLTDFSFSPTDDEGTEIANRVQPGKRPRSSMAPTIVMNKHGQLEAVLGSPGGSSIIQYVTRTLIAMIDWRMNIQQAISAPHFGATNSEITVLEEGTSLSELTDELTKLGHKIKIRALTSGLHGIVFNGVREDGKPGGLAVGPHRSRWAGGADPRREGLVLGQ